MTDDPRGREAAEGDAEALPEAVRRARRRRPFRRYSAATMAEGVALAATVGPAKAGEVLGVPRRTVADWTHAPAATPILAQAERTIAGRLKEAHREALELVMAGLRDPKARLLDKARALEVIGTQLALAEGRATSNLNVRTLSEDPMAGLAEEELRRRAMDFLDELKELDDEDAAAALAALAAPLTIDERREMRKALDRAAKAAQERQDAAPAQADAQPQADAPPPDDGADQPKPPSWGWTA